MASPQTDNGFTRIANELMEQFSMPGMNGSELRVVLFIVRKTYGFGKVQDRISLSQFQQGTGMNRSQAVETIKDLVAKNIVIKDGGIYKLNKNYEEWLVCKRIPPSMQTDTSMQKHTTASMQKHTKTSMQKHTHKRKKETITKETSKTVVLQGEQWNKLIDSFEPINPLFEELYRNTTERSALEVMATKFGYEKLLATIQALPGIVSQPYAPRITKPTELKRDLGKLLLFMKQEEGKVTSKQNDIKEF